jgi:LuxR family maltose regulon positive regulatory protein
VIIGTKIQPPIIQTPLVKRYALMQHLHTGMQGKLTLIVAPAGYGKTTLLSEWIKDFNAQVAWLSLDKQDNDFGRFWSYVIAAINKESPGFGEKLQPMARSVESVSKDTKEET